MVYLKVTTFPILSLSFPSNITIGLRTAIEMLEKEGKEDCNHSSNPFISFSWNCKRETAFGRKTEDTNQP